MPSTTPIFPFLLQVSNNEPENFWKSTNLMPKPINRIVIEFIPQDRQRYPTAGDWFHEGDTLVLKISRMSKPAFTYALTMHELFEALACAINAVSQEAVDAFDMGPGADLDEPGDSDLAPYKLEHAWASVVERVFIGSVGEHWLTYDAAFAELE